MWKDAVRVLYTFSVWLTGWQTGKEWGEKEEYPTTRIIWDFKHKVGVGNKQFDTFLSAALYRVLAWQRLMVEHGQCSICDAQLSFNQLPLKRWREKTLQSGQTFGAKWKDVMLLPKACSWWDTVKMVSLVNHQPMLGGPQWLSPPEHPVDGVEWTDHSTVSRQKMWNFQL